MTIILAVDSSSDARRRTQSQRIRHSSTVATTLSLRTDVSIGSLHCAG